MDNLAVADALYEIADLLEFIGGDVFKVRAYRKAAEAVGMQLEQVEELARKRQLTRIPGIGKAIAGKIEELAATGKIGFLEELRQAVPPGVLDLTRVPGLGARTAMLLYQRLGIDSLEKLEVAARQGALRDLPGMGPRKEEAILAGIRKARRRSSAVSIGAAMPVADVLVEHLRQHPAVVQVEAAGALRRREETVSEISLVIATREAGRVRELLDRIPAAATLGRKLDALLVSPEEFPLALLQKTGSDGHLAELEPLFLSRRPALAGGPPPATEADIYRALGLPFIEPELREGRGEVAAALAGRLPRLVARTDLRGDLHTHTTASDGTASLAEMAEAARALGHRYLAICDHSHSLAIARGLSAERLLAHAAAIRRLNEQWEDFRLLAGTEVDILKDGSLDYPDEVLAQLDVVVASIHSHMSLPQAAQTERLLRAIASPHVDIIAHPFGRVIGRREPYDLDFERIIEACARTGTALEMSASPSRLDLSAEHARLAREAGVKLVINTDAHSTHELGLLPYGVWQARRAWLEPGDLINTMDLPDLLDWLEVSRKG